MKWNFSLKGHTWPNLFWQPALAVIFIALVLFFMNHFSESDVLWAVGAGSLSSSCFIVFGRPASETAAPHRIVGGYFIGILSGLILHFISIQFQDFQSGLLGAPHFHLAVIIASFATGICLFFMSLFRLEHPPAAGMALVIVIDIREYNIILLVFVAAIILATIRRLLCRRLVDLI